MVLTINFNIENDYELLYLIDNYSEEALNVMFDKYHNLIMSLIRKYKFSDSTIEDVYQEARLVLFKAIKTFDSTYSKTFTMYFKLLLENKFKSLIAKENSKSYFEVIKEDTNFIINEEKCLDYVDLKRLSLIEKAVYFQYFYSGNSIDEVSKSLNMTKKQTYNTIYRIKKKLQKQKYK